MAERRCIAIKALWREDYEDGFCIELLGYGGGSIDAAAEKIDELVVRIAESDPEKNADAIADYFQWVANNKQDLGEIERLQALTLVAYAEEQGLIASDEYNGVIYIYEQDGIIIVDRKDE